MEKLIPEYDINFNEYVLSEIYAYCDTMTRCNFCILHRVFMCIIDTKNASECLAVIRDYCKYNMNCKRCCFHKYGRCIFNAPDNKKPKEWKL